MNSLQTHLAKIRSDAAECLLLSSLATDKRSSMFAKMAEHLNELASELEKTQAANPSKDIQAEAAPAINGAARDDTRAPEIVLPVRHDEDAKADVAPQKVARPRRLWPWLLMAVIGVAVGAGLHPIGHFAGYLPSFQDLWKAKRGSAPEDGANPIAALMATEQREREAIFKRLSILSARIENIEGELDKLRNPQAAVTGAAKHRTDGTDDITGTLDKPSEKASDGTSGNAPTARAACERFRSYNPASGTYVTLNGKQRPCP